MPSKATGHSTPISSPSSSSSDLWAEKHARNRQAVEPLAVRMRPRTLDEFAGQQHFLGEGKLLRRMLDADRLTSIILHGPPGTGKTTLAEVIANVTKSRFERANASLVGVKDVRRVIDEATRALEVSSQRTVFFLDEIHRFNRAQQDVLLNDVERGTIILIGATTENPYFAVNSALLSRSTIFHFEPLSEEDIRVLLRRAITDPERGFGKLKNLTVSDDAINHWATMCDGDARRALSALEVAVLSSNTTGKETTARITIDLEAAEQSIQQKALRYDPTGDEHYDVISAFIKSVRGSDPDAAVYWLARMLVAGEDPMFIARRIAILASEDIGNADPRAIQVAAAAYEITSRIGLPECQLTLAQAAIYLAVAPKSNASAMAIWSATSDVREGVRTIEVPKDLRDTHYKAAKEKEGHGENYKYAHDYEGGIAPDQFLGVSKIYYEPTEQGLEARIKEKLAEIRAIHNKKTKQ